MSFTTLLSIPYSLWLPLLSLAALIAAGIVALFAWLGKSKRTKRLNAWDVAAALAFIGCAAAILGEVEHVAEYFLLDNRWVPGEARAMTELWAEIVSTLTTASGLAALGQVIMIDLVLAGDNAIVIGLAAGGLEQKQRTRAILIGIGAATLLRIVFAAFTVELLEIVGLLFAGGILLLWVCWKMWRDLRAPKHNELAPGTQQPKTLLAAAWTIIVADVSMSLDNVLAVAGAARDHPAALLFGLGLSIVLMGVAANFIAGLLEKHRWIAYVGLIIILYVAGDMVYRGAIELKPLVTKVGLLN